MAAVPAAERAAQVEAVAPECAVRDAADALQAARMRNDTIAGINEDANDPWMNWGRSVLWQETHPTMR
jgi:hypothetical protein